MTGPTKRDLASDVEDLREDAETPGDRIELVSGMVTARGPAPELTDFFAIRGFLVAREEREFDNGFRDALLHLTPEPADSIYPAAWHWEGPTAPKDALRVRWDSDAREDAIEAAEWPVECTVPDLPADPTVIVDGDGYDVVAPADRTVENRIIRRADAEYHGFDILRSVPSSIPNADEYDLVEVDADPVEYADRIPTRRPETDP